MRIYITHCCAKKNDRLKETDEEVKPEKLYLATPTQRFIKKCKEKQVEWAIFSDLYGIWSPKEKHTWYEKHPNTVTEKEYKKLLNDFNTKLQKYDEIWFYYNPGRFHQLYKKILKETKHKNKIKKITHLQDI